MNSIDPKISLQKALQISGTNQAQLGKLLGVSRQLINDWKRKDGELPPLYAHRFTKLFEDHFQQTTGGES